MSHRSVLHQPALQNTSSRIPCGGPAKSQLQEIHVLLEDAPKEHIILDYALVNQASPCESQKGLRV